MTVTVKYFASIREQMGQPEALFDNAGGQTVAELWQRCIDAQERTSATMPERVLVAVNQEYVDWSHRIADEDEVAFFPPVTGG